MTLRLTALIAGSAIAAPAALANHVDFIQDDSNPGNGVTNATFSLSTNGPLVTDTQAGEPADVLGGFRGVAITNTGGFGGTFSVARSAGDDVITATNTNVAAGTLDLSYPGISDSDFDTNWNFIAVSIPTLSNNTGDGEINLSVTIQSSTGTGTAFAMGTGIAPGRIEEPGTYFFAFSDPGFAGVDFSDVDGVSVRFESAIIGTDFTIASITREAVPAPGTACLLGLGGLATLRRRRSA